MPKHEPIFNAPRVVLVTLGVLIASHVAREFMTEEGEQWLVLAGAFIPSRYTGEVLPGGLVASYTSFLTHALLHGDYMHLAVNCGWLLAFGAIVARRIRALHFLLLAALCAVAGAALFLASNWGLAQPMVGASGAISGLMGAANRFMFQPALPYQPGALDIAAQRRPCMTFAELMRDRRARLMIGSWVAINMIFGLVLGQLFSAGGIAWEAHLGGFIAGLMVFPWLDRQGNRALAASI